MFGGRQVDALGHAGDRFQDGQIIDAAGGVGGGGPVVCRRSFGPVLLGGGLGLGLFGRQISIDLPLVMLNLPKAIGFAVIVEGVMIISKTTWLSFFALGLLIMINAIACAVALTEDETR